MRARGFLALGPLAFVVLLGGCLPRGTGGEPGCPVCPGGGAVAELSVPFETLDQGVQSGIRHARKLVIRDGETWAALWREHVAERVPQPPLPQVDFTRDMVIAFFLGEKPTAGYAATIKEIRASLDKLLVRVEVTSPPPGSFVAQVLTQPYHIVKLPRSDLPVEFVVVEAETGPAKLRP